MRVQGGCNLQNGLCGSRSEAFVSHHAGLWTVAVSMDQNQLSSMSRQRIYGTGVVRDG